MYDPPAYVWALTAAEKLRIAAIHAFAHSFAAGCLVALGVVAAGALLAWFVLPARLSAEAKTETMLTAADAQLVPFNAPQGGMK